MSERASTTLLAVLWIWTDGPHKGARFWGCHSIENDGRLRDWPSLSLRALGAARVTVVEGEGLELLEPAAAKSVDIADPLRAGRAC